MGEEVEERVSEAEMEEHSEDRGEGTEGMKHVTEAYIRATDVLFEWSKSLEPLQAGALKALFNMVSLFHPDHPLHPGDSGLTIYIGTYDEGKERLLFSLAQVEYIQYYIHAMRLTDAAWADHFTQLAAYNEAADGSAVGEKPQPPSHDGTFDDWVPLPNSFTLPETYDSIEEVRFETAQDFKRRMNQISKKNKRAANNLVKMLPLTESEQVKQEAAIDNQTPGPGLRRGARRRSSNASRRKTSNASEHDPSGGLGWGDFPLKVPDASTTQDAGEEKTEPGVINEGDQAEERTLADRLNELSELAKEMGIESEVPRPPSSAADKSSTYLEETFGEKYLYHARQAAALAAAGGLAQALKHDPAADGAEEAGKDVAEQAQVSEAVGRSLFVSVALTTWEEDEGVVLEAGWAALWWQKKQPFDVADSKDDNKADAEDGRPADEYEEMAESVHYIVQEHVLDMQNGKRKPNNRRDFQYGNSLQISAAELAFTIKRNILDLVKRAGNGPTYIVLHSADADEVQLKKLGWRTADWEKSLHPPEWTYPSYTSVDGVGRVFLIDTAVLFGVIEEGEPGSTLPALGKTRRTLREVAQIMFGDEDSRETLYLGNAGNYANLCLKVLAHIVKSDQTLEDLRADYRRSQFETVNMPKSSSAPSAASAITSTSSTAQTSIPENMVAPPESEPRLSQNGQSGPATDAASATKANSVDDSDSSDDDLKDIKAVYYINEDGEHIQLD